MDEVTPIFGENVFNETVMKARLPKETYKQLMKTIEGGEKLDASVATVVANAMKDWAIEKVLLVHKLLDNLIHVEGLYLCE